MTRRRIFRFIAGAVAGLAFGASTADAYVVAGFGDSITQGSPYNLFPQNGARYGGYIPTLEDLLNQSEPSVVQNWGISGTTTVNGVNRINGVLGASRAQWILIMYGVNDLFEGISLQTTMTNLKLMIDMARNAGTEPVLSNLLPSSVSTHPGHVITSTYNPQIKLIADQKNVYFSNSYEPFARNWPILNRDGLHPNIAGYELLASIWCETLPVCSDSPPTPTPTPPPAPPPPVNETLSWLEVLLLDD